MIGFLFMIKFKFEAKAHFTLDHWKGESLKIPVNLNYYIYVKLWKLTFCTSDDFILQHHY